MKNLNDILTSKEMADVVRSISALKERFQIGGPYHEVPDSPVNLALSVPYDVERILSILRDENKYYDGFKNILMCSFGAWLLDPYDEGTINILITQYAMSHMKRANSSFDYIEYASIEEDIAARYVLTGEEFLLDVFIPLGGYEAFSTAPSTEDSDMISNAIDRKVINTVVRAVAYLHHVADRRGSPGFSYVPSLNRVISVFNELKKPKYGFNFKELYVARSLLHKRWSSSKKTIALLYAASKIEIGENKLIDVILSGGLNYDSHGKYIETWLDRARFVNEHIFAHMSDTELFRDTSSITGEGACAKFTPPSLHEVEAAVWRKKLDNKNRDIGEKPVHGN